MEGGNDEPTTKRLKTLDCDVMELAKKFKKLLLVSEGDWEWSRGYWWQRYIGSWWRPVELTWWEPVQYTYWVREEYE